MKDNLIIIISSILVLLILFQSPKITAKAISNTDLSDAEELSDETTYIRNVLHAKRINFPKSSYDTWSPKKASIFGKKAAFIVANDKNPDVKSAVYLYDHSSATSTRLANDATSFRDVYGPIWHYKKGGVGINDKFITYCVDNSNYIAKNIKSIRLSDNKVFSSSISGRECSNIAANNQDPNGFGLQVQKVEGYRYWSDIYYRKIDSSGKITNKLVERSYLNHFGVYPNPFLVNRGPQLTGDGGIVWLTGGHDDCKTKIKYMTPNGKIHVIPNSVFFNRKVQRPALISAHKNYIFIYNFFDDLAAEFICGDPDGLSTGLTIYDIKTEKTYLVKDSEGNKITGHSQAIYDKVGLYVAGNKIYKINLDNLLETDPILLVTNNDPVNYDSGQVQLSSKGLFVFITHHTDLGPGGYAYISSIWRADANLDGRVNKLDLQLLNQRHYSADFNHDGKINKDDWEILNIEWGANGTTTLAANSGHAPPYSPIKQ